MISGSPHGSATGLVSTACEKSVWEIYSGKGQVAQLSEICLLLDLSSGGGNEEIKLAGLTSLPPENPAKMAEACNKNECLVNPQQDDAEAKLKFVSSYGQGPSLLYVCSASSTIEFSRCYCNTRNKQYSYSKKSVSSVLRQFVKNHLTWILNKHFKYILNPLDVEVFGKIQMD